MPTRVTFTDHGERSLDQMPYDIQVRVLKRIARVPANPRGRGSKKLRGREELWRVRTGDYRIAYTIHDEDELIRIELV